MPKPLRFVLAVVAALVTWVHVSLWSRFPVWYRLFFLASLPVGSYLFAKLWAARGKAAPVAA